MNIALCSTWEMGGGARSMIESSLGLSYLLSYIQVKPKFLFIIYYIFLFFALKVS